MSRQYDHPGVGAVPIAPPPLGRSSAISRDAKQAVSLVVLCQIVHGLTFSAIPLLLPLVRADLGIGFAEAGLLSAVATLSYALGQVPAGFLADRYGATRLVFVGLLGWSVFSLVFGLIHDYWLALASQFLAGAFRSLLFAPGLALLAAWFPKERRASAMSLYMVGGVAGNVLMSLCAPLLAAHYGWRAALMLLALPGIAFAFVYKLKAKERAGVRPGARIDLNALMGLVRQPLMWVCFGLQMVRFSTVTAFTVWLPSLLVADRGFSVQAAGWIVASSAVFAAAGNAFGGYLCDRLRNPPRLIGAALALLSVSALLLVWVEDSALLIASIALYALLMQFYFGALFLVPVEVLGPRFTGSATGFANLFANLGGFATAFALGVLKDASGRFTLGFVAIAAVCVIGVGLSAVLARMRRRALAFQRTIRLEA
ncbi:MAG: MFS transporter [Burkholderiales bacterium]|nr:MFS transporter [Burkholderiales bacterium]